MKTDLCETCESGYFRITVKQGKQVIVSMITGKEILTASRGRLLQGNPEQQITGFVIDSRKAKPGNFFIPFSGENTEGHHYIADAAKREGAGAFIVSGREPDPSIPPDFLLVEIEDPLVAMQRVAAYHRQRFELPVVGITGSSGKTTTKDFTAGVLSAKYKVLKTTGNLNNEIGLPLTILELNADHQVAVLEMGMSAPGEINTLCDIARPSIGVITNIGEAHIEMLGSVEAIARAKGELLDYLGSGGVAVLNGDDPRLLKLGERFPGKVLYYGFNQGDIKGLKLSQRGEKSFFRVRFPNRSEGWFESPLPGRESAGNALAALTVGYILEIDPAEMIKGLCSSRITGGRLQVLYNSAGTRIIDDTYNANPDSVKAALNVLMDLGGEKTVAVLGDMLELGPFTEEAHRAVGRYASQIGVGTLVTVGPMASLAAIEASRTGKTTVYSCDNHEQAIEILTGLISDKGRSVLVKGSRGMEMEKIVRALLD
ncbi:MAG: UDP-N-acetylmuramoyl-tripeptide--D-alanyl-D-alanine ligase [Bacillota bacterium]|nr:UDP-N-acetylmuramoyl-tripeptide--D-alanyl-D-alanine ligase [Bacillota bacterium]